MALSKRHLKMSSPPAIDADMVIENASFAFSNRADGSYLVEAPLLLINEGKVAWLGAKRKAPKINPRNRFRKLDAGGGIIVPGFIDCHTHLVFAGSREFEFFQRNEGASYLEISKRGGGILSTVQQVRQTSERELLEMAWIRLERALDFGITTIEVKSGYGLEMATELKMLRVCRELSEKSKMAVVPTLLAAHAFPPPFRGTREGEEKYTDLICREIIPEVGRQKLALFNDVFVEKGFFDRMQARKIIEKGLEFGLKPKIHADELSRSGGAQLGAAIRAISVDHCDCVSSVDIGLLSKNEVTAVLLPAVTFFLNNRQLAPASDLLSHGVEIALATDFNPGSAMTQSLQLVAAIAAIQMKLTATAIFRALTYGAAKALDLHQTKGSLEPGYDADIVILNVANLESYCYHIGESHVRSVIIGGKQCR